MNRVLTQPQVKTLINSKLINHNNRIKSDWQFADPPLPAGYAGVMLHAPK